MELEARRFARKVILVHLALLVIIVIAVVVAAARIHSSVRSQAIDQSVETQSLLARQTAAAIENFYASIGTILESLKADENEPQRPRLAPPAERLSPSHTGPGGTHSAPPGGRPGAEPATGPNGPPGRPRGPGGILTDRRREQFAENLWESLRDRVSHLIVIDPSAKVIRSFAAADAAFTAQEAVDHSRDWIGTVDKPAISEAIDLAKPGAAYHLLCVPLAGPLKQKMLAVVPMAQVERRFLDQVNRRASIGAMLVDESGLILSNSDGKGVGMKITDAQDPRTQELARKYLRTLRSGTEVFDRVDYLGDVRLNPAIITIQPIQLLATEQGKPQRTWLISVAASLDDVEALVNVVFREATGWAIFLVISMTALLLSTALQLIRGRVRLERMQREVLAKEVADARRIQLSWLPRESCRSARVQLAAINQPATHISGDFYNWFDLKDGRVVVTIGDVTGHGMAAAFLMATTQLLVRNIMPGAATAGACLDEVNRQLCTQAFNGQFVTMLILVIDPGRCEVEIATAGHPPPLMGCGEEFAPMLVDPELVLGIEKDARYPSQRYQLPADCGLVLYTDGVPDLQNPGGDRLGADGLAGCLHGRYDSAEAILGAVRASVDEFRRGRDLADDLTLVAIRFAPSAGQRSATARAGQAQQIRV